MGEREEAIFTTLARAETLSTQVARQIETMIVAARLKPGDPLPPERELGRQLGVSRTVVREAVAALAARSLLEAAPGGGTIVRTPSVASVARAMTLFLRAGADAFDYGPIHEVRRVLEVEIAGLAAARRTEEDSAALAATLALMTAQDGPNETYVEADVAFHRALAVATQNPLFPLLLDTIADVLREVRWRSAHVRGSTENGLRHHRAILVQVETSNVDGARAAMLAHLADSETIQRQALPL